MNIYIYIIIMSYNGTSNWWDNKPLNYNSILPYAKSFETAGYIVSIFSTLITGAVIATMCIFPIMLKNKSMNQIVLFMLIGDFIWGLSCAFGFPGAGTTLCGWQGALLFGIRTSWTWACLMLVQLDGLIYTSALRLSQGAMHAICWPLNIGLQCLPALLKIRYGLAPFYSGLTVCTTEFDGRVAPWRASVYACFIGPMFATVIFLTGMFIKIYIGLQRRLLTASVNIELIRKASLFPAAILVSWLPIVITTCLMINTGHTDGVLRIDAYTSFQVSMLFAIGVGGGAFGILYFNYLPEAGLRWRRLLRQWRRAFRKNISSAHSDTARFPFIFPEIEEDFKDDATMVSVMLREEDIERRSQKTSQLESCSEQESSISYVSWRLSLGECSIDSREHNDVGRGLSDLSRETGITLAQD